MILSLTYSPFRLLLSLLSSSNTEDKAGDLYSCDRLVGLMLQNVTAGNMRSLFLSILMTTLTGLSLYSVIIWRRLFTIRAVIAIITRVHSIFFTGPDKKEKDVCIYKILCHRTIGFISGLDTP